MSDLRQATALRMRTQVLERETFRTLRLLDFCSVRELVKQIGHAVSHADQKGLAGDASAPTTATGARHDHGR